MATPTRPNKFTPPLVTFERVQLGIFKVLINGVESKTYTVENGSLGLTGRDSFNMYCIFNQKTLKVTPIGSLRNAKAMMTSIIHLRAQKQFDADTASAAALKACTGAVEVTYTTTEVRG